MTSIELAATDFIALEEFELAWRWTDETNLLPDVDRKRIRPLTPSKAAALAPMATHLCEEQRDIPKWLSTDQSPVFVRRRLEALNIDGDTRILVSWNATTAVVTDWDLFCRYWDDFCYPSSDDVTILPLTGEWVLCYDHSEAFRLDHPAHAV
jgi:hypothetical protein